MTTILLIGCIPLIVLAAWVDHRRRRDSKTATATEWRARMARLDTQRPVQSVLDEKGRRIWSEKRGAFVKSAATWEVGKPEEGKVEPITKTGTRR